MPSVSFFAGLAVSATMVCSPILLQAAHLRPAVLGIQPLLSSAGQADPAVPKSSDTSAANPSKEESSITDHTIAVNGQTISYQANASTILLRDDKGEPIALMYSAAYSKSGADASRRPIAFLYNGGPGAASMWLHMGAFGPKRVLLNGTDAIPPAPYTLIDNAETLLDKTDLVFIDAIGTGYSHAVGNSKNTDFYGTQADATAFAQFIDLYLSRYHRWNSPKFLIGESYGTFRSAAVSSFLKSKYSIDLNGIVLISSVLDLSTMTFSPNNDRPCVFYLPSYAATAWYYKMLEPMPEDLPAFLEKVRSYAQGDYAAALFQGSKLPPAQKAAVAQKLSDFTGISPGYWLKANLCVTDEQFEAELRRREGMSVAALDPRFSGYDYDPLEERSESDPLEDGIESAFTALVNEYNHDDLKFGQDKLYHNARSEHGWEWWKRPSDHGFPTGPQTAADLARAMISNPNLLIQVENGYFDLATPFFATEFTMDHLPIPAALDKNITMKYYETGHMMYLDNRARRKLHDNIAGFIDMATRQ